MTDKSTTYESVLKGIDALLEEPCDWIAAMSTVACELHSAFDYFHWTGFYRTVATEHLQVGPYQGGHGCIDIPFSRGVCGAAARTKSIQLVDDVDQFPGHIACSSSTVSEIVVPVLSQDQTVIAVLDVDSDFPAAFDATDQHYLGLLCAKLGQMYGAEAAKAIKSRS
jgi:L-methionine (R)-S-oxide reductase